MATNHYDWSNGPDAIQQHSKKAGHAFDDTDFARLINYVDAFEQFFGQKLKQSANLRSFQGLEKGNRVKRMSWRDFLTRAKKVHEQFLDVHDLGTQKRQGKRA